MDIGIKLKLVCVYIKEFRLFKDFTMNLSPDKKVEIKWNENNIEEIKVSNTEYYKNMNFDSELYESINPTCIVGENGTGKTSLLEIIGSQGDVFESNLSLFIFSNSAGQIFLKLGEDGFSLGGIKLDKDKLYEYTINSENNVTITGSLESIFIALIKDKDINSQPGDLYYGTPEGGKNNPSKNNIMTKFYIDEINHVNWFKAFKEIILFKGIKFKTKTTTLELRIVDNNKYDIENQNIKSLINIYKNNNEKKDKKIVSSYEQERFCLAYLTWISDIKNNSENEVLINKINEYNVKPTIKGMKHFFSVKELLAGTPDEKYINDVLDILKLLKSFTALNKSPKKNIAQLRQMGHIFTFNTYIKINTEFESTASNNYLSINDENIMLLFEKLQTMNSSVILRKLFYFNFRGLSSGQYKMINTFSLIKKACNDSINLNYQNIILLLDEPDTYLHPEWSRRFFSLLQSILKKYEDQLNIQLILTTHSPFVLSDFVKERVVKLAFDKNDYVVQKVMESETLGANIYDLLNNEFFIESSMGEYIKNKLIQTKEKILNKDNIDDSGYKKWLIDNIGEEYIKNYYRLLLSHSSLNNEN